MFSPHHHQEAFIFLNCYTHNFKVNSLLSLSEFFWAQSPKEPESFLP
jgi:hypothetical protein